MKENFPYSRRKQCSVQIVVVYTCWRGFLGVFYLSPLTSRRKKTPKPPIFAVEGVLWKNLTQKRPLNLPLDISMGLILPSPMEKTPMTTKFDMDWVSKIYLVQDLYRLIIQSTLQATVGLPNL